MNGNAKWINCGEIVCGGWQFWRTQNALRILDETLLIKQTQIYKQIYISAKQLNLSNRVNIRQFVMCVFRWGL